MERDAFLHTQEWGINEWSKTYLLRKQRREGLKLANTTLVESKEQSLDPFKWCPIQSVENGMHELEYNSLRVMKRIPKGSISPILRSYRSYHPTTRKFLDRARVLIAPLLSYPWLGPHMQGRGGSCDSRARILLWPWGYQNFSYLDRSEEASAGKLEMNLVIVGCNTVIRRIHSILDTLHTIKDLPGLVHVGLGSLEVSIK